MFCPATNPKAAASDCSQRILSLMERQEILRCRACPHGQKLLDACSSKMPVADMDDVAALPIPKSTQQTKLLLPWSAPMEAQPQRRIWTVSELAAVLGVKGKDIYNARNP